MFKLKSLSKTAISGALEKAMRYRLLNEPRQAESICRDILQTDPKNQSALVTLILALTDQFGLRHAPKAPEIRELLPQLESEYEQAYYAGIILERQAKEDLRRDTPHSGYIAYDRLREAMDSYEKAEKIHPQDNEDAVLRWNACARMIMLYNLEEKPEEDHYEPLLD